MRLTRYHMPTLREKPAEAEIPSHSLMLRAGMVRKLAAGIYSFLPLGWRVVKKIMEIVREEMDRAGALEVFLPVVQPAELWMESGRWSVFGKELLRFKDRNQRDFCLGPTHEEVIVDLVRGEVRSYKQLPLNLYQIHIKFRDEARPRFGIIRAREFIMKDAYSFDKDWESLDRSYNAMYEAYSRIFKRCGLDFVVVEAESGAIGGDVSHEFMVWAPNGEDTIVYCRSCGYAANLERAASREVETSPSEQPADPEKVHTPDVRTIDEVSAFLKIEPSRLLKSLIYKTEKGYVLFLIPGDRELNEAKAKRAAGVETLEMADPAEVYEIAGASVGFVGPVGLKKRITVIADRSVKSGVNFVSGANEDDYHIVNITPEKDFEVDGYEDIVFAAPGDLCPKCGSPLEFSKGIEVGHIFKLGTKYSEPMKAYFLDEDGKEKPFVMGCYGIGVTRIAAAVIEQRHDDNGIMWPITISPFEVYLLATNMKNEKVKEVSEKLYQGLLDEGIEVLYDDRDERAGVKFKDADLVGIPVRVTVGERRVANDEVEIKLRHSKETLVCSVDEAVDRVKEIVKQLYEELEA
ncbi:MAG: proline--tRNA ligase [Deferribacteres bacterium]|nr:proline--tRNA ligase [Deferribacteres bacterium]